MFVVFFLSRAVDDKIVCNVQSSVTPLNYLTDDVLVFFGRGCDAKHHSLVPVEGVVASKRGDVTRVLLELDLVKTPSEVDLGKDSAAVELVQNFVYRGIG